MTDAWYVHRAGRQFGPFTAQQLRQLARSGKLAAGDQVRRADQKEWAHAAHVSGLFAPASATPLVPSEPAEAMPAPLVAAPPSTPGAHPIRSALARNYRRIAVVAGVLLVVGLIAVFAAKWALRKPRPEGWVDTVAVEGVQFRAFDDETDLGRLQFFPAAVARRFDARTGQIISGDGKSFTLRCDGRGWLFTFDGRGQPFQGGGVHRFSGGNDGRYREDVSCHVEPGTTAVYVAIVDDPAGDGDADARAKQFVKAGMRRYKTREHARAFLSLIGQLDDPRDGDLIAWLAWLAGDGAEELHPQGRSGGLTKVSGPPSLTVTALDAARIPAATGAYVYSNFAARHKQPIETLLARGPEVRLATLGSLLHHCAQVRAAVPDDAKEWLRSALAKGKSEDVAKLAESVQSRSLSSAVTVLLDLLSVVPVEHKPRVVQRITALKAQDARAVQAVRAEIRALQGATEQKLVTARGFLLQELQRLDAAAWAEERQALGEARQPGKGKR